VSVTTFFAVGGGFATEPVGGGDVGGDVGVVGCEVPPPEHAATTTTASFRTR